MPKHSLTLDSPLSRRFLAWMDERFPAANSVLVVVMYLVCAAVSRFSSSGGELAFSLVDILGALATWSMFLLLRVFDEHKDYDLDVKNYPERVLQSGLITLTHLKIVGGLAIVFQLALSVWIDGGFGSAVLAWVLMTIWASLMTAEFFCGEWLEKRLTLYATTHMAIMPLIIWWIVNLAVPGVQFNPQIIALMLLAFTSGFCFEITRKTRGPEEERDSVDSYTKSYGVKGCSLIISTLLVIMFLVQGYLIKYMLGGGFWIAMIFVVAFIGLALKSVFSFLSAPTLEGREKNEKMVGLAMIGGYFVIISAAIVERGITFLIY